MEQKTKYKIAYLVLLLGVSLPLFVPGIEGHFGQDLGFHLNRIEGLFLELKSGHFPVYIESYWMNGYGYANAIYYGDLFLYFPAILRLLGVPVVASYKLYLLAINICTILICKYCFQKIFKEDAIAFFVTLAYCSATYRMVNLFIRGAVGEYTAMMFLPLIGYCLYEIYGKNDQILKEWKLIFVFAFSMSGILYSHLLTFEITTICVLVLAVLLIKKTLTKRVIGIYLKSAVLCAALCMSFLVPFLDYYRSEYMYINHSVENARLIQDSGLYWWELLDFFRMPFANVEGSGITRLLAIPGMLLMFVLFIESLRIIRRESSKVEIGLFVGTGCVLFLASRYFPWNYLSERTFVGTILASVQFPWRYLSIGILIICFLYGVILGKENHKRRKIICVLSIGFFLVMTFLFTSMYIKYGEMKYFDSTESLDSYDMGFIEYLPYETKREEFTNQISVNGDGEAVFVDRTGTDVTIFVETSTEADIELPIIFYKGYHARYSNGQEVLMDESENHLITLHLKEACEDSITLRFEPPASWRIAMWISLATLCGCVGIMFRNRRRYE